MHLRESRPLVRVADDVVDLVTLVGAISEDDEGNKDLMKSMTAMTAMRKVRQPSEEDNNKQRKSKLRGHVKVGSSSAFLVECDFISFEIFENCYLMLRFCRNSYMTCHHDKPMQHHPS